MPARPVMVAITGWGMEADRRRTGELGFDHHLVKPVATDALRDILSAVTVTMGMAADRALR
jgi:CheY-like chemotaxis protein